MSTLDSSHLPYSSFVLVCCLFYLQYSSLISTSPNPVLTSYLSLLRSLSRFSQCIGIPKPLGRKSNYLFFSTPHYSILHPIFRGKKYVTDWPNSRIFIGQYLLKVESLYSQRYVFIRYACLPTLTFILAARRMNGIRSALPEMTPPASFQHVLLFGLEPFLTCTEAVGLSW